MTNNQLDEALKELGREHRAIDAPESLQHALYAAAKSRNAVLGKPRLYFTWASAAVATLLTVVALAGVVWRSLQTHQPQTQQTHSLPVAPVNTEPLHSSSIPTSPSLESNAPPMRQAARSRRALRHPSPPTSPTSSSLDAFVPLPVSEGLPTAAELSIVRIRLRASDLQQYGLQTPADSLAQTMLAEFAVGEDGLPRAIRIVR
jgi:hypothetical protein